MVFNVILEGSTNYSEVMLKIEVDIDCAGTKLNMLIFKGPKISDFGFLCDLREVLGIVFELLGALPRKSKDC